MIGTHINQWYKDVITSTPGNFCRCNSTFIPRRSSRTPIWCKRCFNQTAYVTLCESKPAIVLRCSGWNRFPYWGLIRTYWQRQNRTKRQTKGYIIYEVDIFRCNNTGNKEHKCFVIGLTKRRQIQQHECSFKSQ